MRMAYITRLGQIWQSTLDWCSIITRGNSRTRATFFMLSMVCFDFESHIPRWFSLRIASGIPRCLLAMATEGVYDTQRQWESRHAASVLVMGWLARKSGP